MLEELLITEYREKNFSYYFMLLLLCYIYPKTQAES